MQAAELLQRVNPRQAWRIATDEPLPLVLMRLCDAATGWEPAR